MSFQGRVQSTLEPERVLFTLGVHSSNSRSVKIKKENKNIN